MEPDAPREEGSLRVGDRVRVFGGYEGPDPKWLAGSPHRLGKLTQISGSAAVVELDEEIQLEGGEWSDFGTGSAASLGTVTSVRGRWLVVILGWVGSVWTSPTGRVHVGVCATAPDLGEIPPGGGIGVWVESHATVERA